MKIRLDNKFNAFPNKTILGYVGETNARTITFSGLSVSGANSYSMIIDYGDGENYEVNIVDGVYTVDASVLKRPGLVNCQVLAKALSEDGTTYTIVKKSNIFALNIGKSIDPGAIPTYEQATSAVEKLIQINPNANDVLKFTEQIDQNVDNIAELQSDFNGMGAMKRYFHSGSKTFDNTEPTIPAGTTIYFRPISADDSRTGLIMYGLYSANESDGLDRLFPQALFGVTGKIVTEREYHHVRVVTYPYGGTEFSFDYLRTNTPGIQPDISDLQSDVSGLQNEIGTIDGLVKRADWMTYCKAKTNSTPWISNKKYHKGFINSVTVYVDSGEDTECSAIIYRDNGNGTATKYFTCKATGKGYLTIPVNRICEYDFYVAIQGVNTIYGTFSSGEYSSGATASTTFNLSGCTKKYYHAYEISMTSVYDTMFNNFALKSNALESFPTTLNNSYFTGNATNIIELPNNKIYAIGNDITDFSAIGLPCNGHGTLTKFRPFGISSTGTGYTVYTFTVLRGTAAEQYFAYAVNNQTPEALQWYRYNTSTPNRGIDKLGVEDLSIVFIGDSIVEGFGSSDYNGGASGTSGHQIPNTVKTWYRNTGAKCWANQMIDYLTSTYNGVTACNNGIGGFTPQNVYDNLDTLTMDDNGNRANVVVLSIGTNSRNSTNKESDIVTPIRNIIKWLKNKGIQPIVLTNTPIIDAAKGNNAETIQSCIVRACNMEQVKCYDLLSRLNRYMWEHDIPLEWSADQTKIMHDKLHPADMMYDIMFNLIKEILIA